MTAQGARVDLDDRDPRIVYSSGWHISPDVAAYDGTLHYATEEGLTATLVFTGGPSLSSPSRNIAKHIHS